MRSELRRDQDSKGTARAGLSQVAMDKEPVNHH